MCPLRRTEEERIALRVRALARRAEVAEHRDDASSATTYAAHERDNVHSTFD
jgi:hypothetical protein